jgi:hypothetical protein
MNFSVIKINQKYNIKKLQEEVIEILKMSTSGCVALSGTTPDFDMYSFYIGPLKNTDIKEDDFRYLNPMLNGTVIEQIWNNNKKSIGRFRILTIKPFENKYSKHVDADYRTHMAIFTNESSFLEIDSITYHIPADGSAYLCNTKKIHTAYNHGNTNRVHLVWNDRNCE